MVISQLDQTHTSVPLS